MKCASITLIATLLTVSHCLEIITVTVGSNGDEFHPSQIAAPSNTTLRFLLPSNFFSIVQSTFDQPCAPLPGGFNSDFYGGNLDPSVWDLNIQDSTQPLWFFYQNALQPTPCDEGIVGVINSPSTLQYTEFRKIAKNANLDQSNSVLPPCRPACPASAVLMASISDPATSSFSPLLELLPTPTVILMTPTSHPAVIFFSPLPGSLPNSGAIPMTSTSDPAMSSFSSLPQLLPTSSLIPMSSNPAASSFSQLPQLLPTSSTPLPTRPPAHRNVGAIVAGTVVGAFAGIIALVVLANVAVLLYRRWRDNEAYENTPPQAPRAPPPEMTAERHREAVPSGPVEMTQVSIPGDEPRIYRSIQSNGIPSESIPERRSAATRPSSTQSVTVPAPAQGVTVPAPAMRRSMHIPRSRPHSQVETSTRCQLLLSSDPFASLDHPLSADAVQQRQQQQQHQQQQQYQQYQQRTPNIRRSRHRHSRSDSSTAPMIPETQPAIPEQDIEFIAQEVSSLIIADPAPAHRPTSHVSYSSPSVGQRSPTLGFARKSPTINFRNSPVLSYTRPAGLKRSISRGSSMEGG